MQFNKVLVTGASGFIGSHLTERLVREGYEVTAFLHYNSRGDIGLLQNADPALLRKIKIYFGDLKDFNAVLEATKGQEIVFHLGALIGIPYSYVHPADVVETNVIGTLNVLMAAKDAKVKRIIHTSTSEVYGTAKTERISEEHPLQGQSPYSASKIAADKLVESFYNSYQLPVVTVRPFNTYGPRQSMRAIIPTIIAQTLFQKEICLGSLEPVRDFTYVSDTVEGFLLAGSIRKIEGEVFNLGVDDEISIKDIVMMIFHLTNLDKPVDTKLDRIRPEKSEVFRLRSNNNKAQERMGWVPRVSLEEGLGNVIEWIRSHPEAYSAKGYVI